VAESLSKHKGDRLSLGLSSLSDAAAESLSKHKGELAIPLRKLSDSAAWILRNHPSFAESGEEDEDWDSEVWAM